VAVEEVQVLKKSFVSGDGSTTFIKVADRKIAPAILE